MYAKRNEAQLPLDIIQIHHGQDPACSMSFKLTVLTTEGTKQWRLASELSLLAS